VVASKGNEMGGCFLASRGIDWAAPLKGVERVIFLIEAAGLLLGCVATGK